MNFFSSVSISEIKNLVGAEIIGTSTFQPLGINEIHKVKQGDITFVDHPKYYEKCLNSNANFILINKKIEAPINKILLYVEDPFDAYNKIVMNYFPFISQKSSIDESATIGENTIVQPGVSIGPNVVVGKNCIIHFGVCIYANTIIEDNCIIHANTVLGSDAFYFKKRMDRELYYDKMQSCGRVIVRNNAEIGSCCTIDKGVSGDTIIGEGSKLDNHIHIGHGVVIGKNVLIAAQVGIAGKTIIENGVTIWGQVGINKTLTVGENAEIFAQSGIASTIDGNKKYFGSPAEEAYTKKKEIYWIKMIPKLKEEIEKLKKNFNK